MYNYSLKGHHFPQDMLLVNMTLIPKPNKDNTLSQNFRPLLVINNDFKIFAHMLASRLLKVITSLVSPDKTVLITSKQLTDNIQLAMNVLQYANI